MEGVCTVSVLEQYLALKYQNKLSILMIMDGILFDIGYCNIDRKIILICDLFK